MTESSTNAPLAPGKASQLLAGVFGEVTLTTTSFRDNVRIYLAPSQLLPALQVLRDRGAFNLLEIGGIDYLGYPRRDPGKSRFEVHYVLLNFDTHERIILKVGVDDPSPSIPSAVSLWIGANWMEREIFDMYGIGFEGHPDLRRILMPEEFVSHPLRKDYPLRGRGERHNFPRLTRDES